MVLDDIAVVDRDDETTEGHARGWQRVQTEIEFPYADLPAAIELVQRIHDNAGASCDDEEIAAWLDMSVNGGTFRARRSAARMFGLIEVSGRRLTVTPLGHRIVDNADKAARAEAFLKPELFSRMYDEWRGQTLPPVAAIERQMTELGVPPKQKTRARQVFQKSAQCAGFIDQPTGRFVRPGNSHEVREPPASTERRGGGSGGGGSDGVDPIIGGLLARLPKSGDVWPEAERKLWLQILENSFKLIYKDSPDKGQSGPQDA
jgi:hypothetical protein